MSLEDIRGTPTIEVYSGHLINLAVIRPEDIHLEDIAVSLSHICRFNGHGRTHYSVAQHSVYVFETVLRNGITDWWNLSWALLHDAAEAYLGDITGLVKQILLEESPTFRMLEKKIELAILAHFRIDPNQIDYKSVKKADIDVLCAEKIDLMSKCIWPGIKIHTTMTEKVVPWSPEVARQAFLKTAAKLGYNV